MKRTIRKPGFWVALIIGSFIINIIVAWITLHKHFTAAGDVLLFGPPTTTTNTKGSDPIPESVVWHRMLQEHADNNNETIVSSSSCDPRNRTTLSFQGSYYPTTSLRGGGTRENNRTLLLPGGFRADVGRFVREKEARSSSSSSSETCFLPPSSSCQVSKYAVIVYSDGQNLRQLFLNLLSFMAYPSVSDITLILPFDIGVATTSSVTTTTLSAAKDTSYANRIIEWGKRRTIRLFHHNSNNGETSLWSAMQKNNLHGSESILWINGDARKDWTGNRLKQTLQTWRDNPRLLFATRVVESSSSRCPFPDLHQLMMHRNFLCYLGHPVMNAIRQHAVVGSSSSSSSSSSSWNMTQTAVTMIWNHVANGHVIVPPPIDGGGNQTFETSVGIAKGIEEGTNLILDYFECDCVWPSTTQLSSLNGTCYQ
jgi:hypothetical protein